MWVKNNCKCKANCSAYQSIISKVIETVNIDQKAYVKGALGCYTAKSNSDNGYWCQSKFLEVDTLRQVQKFILIQRRFNSSFRFKQ